MQIYIYNFSLCKEVKDNHLNVVFRDNRTDTVCDAESSMCTCAVKQLLIPPFRPPAANLHNTHNVKDLSRTSIQEAFVVTLTLLSFMNNKDLAMFFYDGTIFFFFPPIQFIQK